MPLVLVADTGPDTTTSTTCDVVTVEDYRRITKDTTTDTDAVQVAVDEAILMTGNRLGRKLCKGTYTEPLRPDSHGRMWPEATPLESVSVPSGGRIRGNSIVGAGGWVGHDYTIVGWAGETETDVTYVGGFLRAVFPPRLRRAIVLMAWVTLHPTTSISTSVDEAMSSIVANASSIRVGDVAVTSSSSSGDTSSSGSSVSSTLSLAEQINADLAPFRRRHLVP